MSFVCEFKAIYGWSQSLILRHAGMQHAYSPFHKERAVGDTSENQTTLSCPERPARVQIHNNYLVACFTTISVVCSVISLDVLSIMDPIL